MFRNYLGFAGCGFYFRCRHLGFRVFMVWLRVWVLVVFFLFFFLWSRCGFLDFGVMTWFNGMVEFLVKFWLMDKWWALRNCDWTNAWLPTSLL